MNRKEFIEQLSYLLQDIEDEERQAALEYYEDYFDEAGIENEALIIEELGSPERVAAIIKAGLENRFDQDIEYTESKMDNTYYQQNQEIIEAKIVDDKTNQTKDSHFKGNPERNRILLIGIIVGAIFLFGIAGSALISIAFALFMAILGVCFGILIGGFACLIGAVVCFIKGIMLLGSYLGAGLLILATGFGLLALSLLFFYLDGWIIKLIPRIFKACVKLAREALYFLQQFFNRGGQTE